MVSGYATNMVAPAMPIVMQKDRTFFCLFGLAVNSEFHYPRYFSIMPSGGPKPKESFAEGFFAVAAEQNPKPQTLAMVGADAEFPRNAMEGARAQAKQYGLKIVYDKTYPPTTADYTPIVRAVAATNPDIFLACSYPPIRSASSAPPAKPASSRSSTAAAWSACRPPPSRRSSGRS